MLSEFFTTKKILIGLGMILVGILVGAIQDYFGEMSEGNQSYSPVHSDSVKPDYQVSDKIEQKSSGRQNDFPVPSGSVKQSYQSYEEIKQKSEKNELIERINRQIGEVLKTIDQVLSK